MERKDLIYRVLRELHKNGENELLIALANEAGIKLSIREYIDYHRMFAPSQYSIAKSLKKEYMELRRCLGDGFTIRDEQIRERYLALREIFGNPNSSESTEESNT